MNKNLKFGKLDSSFLYLIIFCLSSILTFIIGELYFYTPNGVDYGKYIKYIEYFENKSESTHTGQGIIYYYLISLITFIRRDNISNLNIQNAMNSNIQFGNFLIYLIGLYGFYLLLKRYKYSNSTIFVSFTALNFIMPIFIMRAILKPEILAFSLIPWILLGLERYFESPNYKNFFLTLFPLVISLNIKGSITAMVGLILLFKYVKNLKFYFKRHLICFLILLSAFSIMFIENQNINSYNVFEHNLTGEENYNNKAPLSFYTNINKWDFYYFPIFPYHNNSAIGITLLDTYGDYFNIFIDYDEHLFYYERPNLSIMNLEDSDGFKFGKYVVNYSSIIFSIFLYGFGLYYSIKDKTKIVFYLSPIIGIFIVFLSAFGIPFNHFDPLVGDTLKTNYYSFLIGVSVIFLTSSIFKKINFRKLILLIFLPILFFTALGFPKINQEKIDFYLEEKIQISPFCSVISIFSEDIATSDCFDKTKKFCDYNIASNDAQIMAQNNLVEENLSVKNPINLLDLELKEYKSTSKEECRDLLKKGYKVDNPLFKEFRLLPIFNFLFLICSIISIIYLSFSENKSDK